MDTFGIIISHHFLSLLMMNNTPAPLDLVNTSWITYVTCVLSLNHNFLQDVVQKTVNPLQPGTYTRKLIDHVPSDYICTSCLKEWSFLKHLITGRTPADISGRHYASQTTCYCLGYFHQPWGKTNGWNVGYLRNTIFWDISRFLNQP